jgi:outer membrane receptor protein involved in Fe transport
VDIIKGRGKKMMKSIGRAAMASFFGLLCGVPWNALEAQTAAPAPADTELQEIVVTAERRVSDVQKTAASISVRDGDDMLTQGRYSVTQILEDVPGIVVTPTGNGLPSSVGTDVSGINLTIRGVPSNTPAGGTAVQGVSAVAVYTDGVYEGIGGNYDINRVEVLRGPQGTLYGRSATAGVVAIHTNDPELGQFGGDVSLEGGRDALQHYTGAINIPLGDEFAIRLAGNYYGRDNYVPGTGELWNAAGRIKLLFKPNDNLTALVGYAYDDNYTDTGGTVANVSGGDSDYTYTSNPLGHARWQNRQYWGELDWNFGPATLTYSPTFRQYSLNAFNVTPFVGTFLTQPLLSPLDQFHTQELRLASNPGSKLIWQVGANYYDNRLRQANTTLLGGEALLFALTQDKQTQDAGVFGEATYPFTEDWRITGGVRYDHTYVSTGEIYTNAGGTLVLPNAEGTFRFNNETYKARVEHDLTPKNMVYAMYATGFLPGDVEVTTCPSGAPCTLPFKEETLSSYEIGSKNRFWDDRLQVNGDLYFYDYGGYQTAGINISGNPDVPSFATLAVPSKTKGAELEVQYLLTADDRIGLNYGYTDAYFFNIPAMFAANSLATRPANVPLHSVNASYERRVHLPGGSKLTLRGDARFMTGYDETLNISPGEAAALPYIHVGHQVIGDVVAAWTSSSDVLSISVYGRNVGDNRYRTQAQTQGGATVTATPYDPLTFGIVLGVHF